VRGAERFGARTALVVDDDRATYAELRERVESVARSLAGLGVRRGDRVGLLMPNSVAFLELVFACSILGAVSVPINARFRAVELRHVVPDAQLQLLVVADPHDEELSFLARAEEAFPALARPRAADGSERLQIEAAPSLRHAVAIGSTRPGWVSGDAFAAAGATIGDSYLSAARLGVALRHDALIYYTSGTTALPKGCALSHEAMVRQGQETGIRLGYRDGDVMFSPLPMFHTGCTQFLFGVLWYGGTYVSMARFDAEAGLRMIDEEGVTLLVPAFPAVTQGLMDNADYSPDTFVSSRVLFHIGTPDQLRSLQERLPHTTVVTGFGMTEQAGSVAIGDPAHPLDRRVWSGPPLAGSEIAILDLETARPVAGPGIKGEIGVRGPTLFSGYLNLPERTAESFTDQGWFRTGDLGLLDEHGDLRFLGRLKDVLKIGGENVGSVEIESYLETHPDVRLAQVVGVPDDRLGEVAAAFVELTSGGTATAEDLIAHCDGAIASFKVPRHVRFVTEWPMSATKVKKGELRAAIAEELGFDP
jgi:fatty-acyl-CoA synthase